MRTGILRVRNVLKSAGVEAPHFSFTSFFMVTIKRPMEYNGIPTGISEKSSEKSSEKVLVLLKTNPSLSAAMLALDIGITDRAVEKLLLKLKKEKQIERIGPAKGGHWEIIGKE